MKGKCAVFFHSLKVEDECQMYYFLTVVRNKFEKERRTCIMRKMGDIKIIIIPNLNANQEKEMYPLICQMMPASRHLLFIKGVSFYINCGAASVWSITR